MTLQEFREHPAVQELFPRVGPALRQLLIGRMLDRSRGAKCQIETAQAELAKIQELANLIEDLALVGMPIPELTLPPKMKPLNSMSEPEK